MSRLGVPHLVFSLVALVVFAGMGVTSLAFQETAQWFPLYTAVLGGAIALAAAVVSGIAVARHRTVPADAALATALVASEDAAALAIAGEDAADEPEKPHMTARGFGWLGVWLGLVVVSLLIGSIAASALLIGIWFRTVHKWPFKLLVPLVIVITVLLILAARFLNIRMPGPTWVQELVG